MNLFAIVIVFLNSKLKNAYLLYSTPLALVFEVESIEMNLEIHFVSS